MLFAASGDSHRQLLCAGFLRYPPSWCLRAQEGHPGSWALRQQEGGFQGPLDWWEACPLHSCGPAQRLGSYARPCSCTLSPLSCQVCHFPHFPSKLVKSQPQGYITAGAMSTPPHPTDTPTHTPPVGWPPKAATFSSSGFPVFLLLFIAIGLLLF